MARKSSSVRRPQNDGEAENAETRAELGDTGEVVAAAPVAEETPVTRTKQKVADEQSSNSSVGLGDIRKAVAFVNSVGGMDKAMNLLQILKVAKEIQ